MPPDPINLRVRFDGRAPGLANHRISIGSLALPLNQLLKATRRIASDIIMAAQKANSGRGRYADAARAIDLQIEQMAHACVEIDIIPSINESFPSQGQLFPADILSQTMNRLLDDMEGESHGQFRNAAVRNYLKMLPLGLETQQYHLYRNGAVVKKVDLSKIALPETETIPPTLQVLSGSVSGVSFAPGPFEVWFRPEDGGLLRCSAAEESIERALSVRSIPVEVLLERTSEKPILLWLKKKGERSTETDDKKREHVFRRWDTVLKRLAE